MFALLAVPLTLGAGIAIDVMTRNRAETMLQEAADAAAVAAATKLRDGAQPGAAQAFAMQTFHRHCAQDRCGAGATLTFTFPGQGRASAAASAGAATSFLKVVGLASLRVTATADARYGFPYTDVHFVLDLSGSMNIPDGPTEMAKLHAAFKPYDPLVGCSFACHRADDNGLGLDAGRTGFEVARAEGILLREDRVRNAAADAVNQLAASAVAAKLRYSVARFGLGVGAVFEALPTTNDPAEAIAAINALVSNSNGTPLEWTLGEIAARHQGGTGAPSDPRSIVLLVTDGVESGPPPSYMTVLSPSACSPAKAGGATLIVLNIRYPDPVFHSGNPGKSLPGIPQLPLIQDFLRSCASPGFYFEAEYGGTVDKAFQEIVAKIERQLDVYLTR